MLLPEPMLNNNGEFPAQWPVAQSFDVFFDQRLNKLWVSNREAGDLRRHRAHYYVTVMSSDIHLRAISQESSHQ